MTDTRWIFVAQAGRAFGYGLAAVLLGSTLAASRLNATQVGLLLAAIVAGTVVASLAVGAVADRAGRRRTYLVLYLLLGGTGVVFAATSRWPVLVAAALVGVLSTEVVSLGALAAALPAAVRQVLPGAPADRRYFAALTVVALLGVLATVRLSPAVERATAASDPAVPAAARTVPVVWRLAGLFAVDSFAGGFVVQAFLVYWLQHRYGASAAVTGVVLFALGVLGTLSFLVAPPLAHRVGLLPTMVFTHLPSNLLLAAVAFAPNLATATGLLLARAALSQMDVPTRQAYVMALVPAAQRTRAAAVTNTARYLTRPAGAALLGPAQLLGAGLPFLLAGAVKTGYDLVLWAWFRHVQLPEHAAAPDPDRPALATGGTP